jgi:hypothetical protein
MEKNMRGTRVGDDKNDLRLYFTNFRSKLIQSREWLSDPRGN